MSELHRSDAAHNLLIAADVQLPRGTYVGANVILYPGVRLGLGCHLEDGAIVGKVPRIGVGSASPPAIAEPTVLGAGTVVGTYTVVRVGVTTGEDVFIGDHVLVREGARLGRKVSIGRASTVGRGAVIGDRVRTQGYCGIAAGVIIEDDCFIGADVMILAGITMRRGDPTSPGPAVLRRGCQIGCGVQILSGVVIGEEAIVGAGALVSKDVPAGTTVRGVPAR